MLKRRAALTLATLATLATVPVLSGISPASASATRPQVPFSRGGPGDGSGDPNGPDKKPEAPKDNCPKELWTVPLEIKGLACILLLPKPEGPGGSEGGSGGLGGLLG
jgi:hypothetical protein